jgi:superfamily II DNA/RNA helicase
MTMLFKNFSLDQRILNVLEKIGYKEPTPIQNMAIPKILEGLDLVASAQTGTGKTAAFLLPVLHKLTAPYNRQSKGPRLVILVPTRELAMQVANEAKRYSAELFGTHIACIYGGVSYDVQKKMLSKNLDILVATPGRLIDLMEQNRVDLSRVEVFVLDEADRMLDMGFIGPVEQIASHMPELRQTLLFSATIDKKILHLSKKLQKDPIEIRFQVDQPTSTQIEQKLYYVDGIKHKMRLLDHLLENTDIGQAIVFTATKRKADELADHLQTKGYSSGSLHGDMNQRQRTRTVARLREGKIKFLVATDVASRGIDVATLSHVINFDLPAQSEDFIHRIGRTGRAGATGIAISFATHQEERVLKEISKLTKSPMMPHIIVGLEPSLASKSISQANTFSQRRHNSDKRTHSFEKKPGSFDRKSSSFDRKSSSFDRKSGSFDRKPSGYDRESGSFDRKPSGYDRESGSFDRKPSGYDRESGSFDRKPSGYDREPGSFDRKSSGYDRESGSFDRKSSSLERKPKNKSKNFFSNQNPEKDRNSNKRKEMNKPGSLGKIRNESNGKSRVYRTLSISKRP